MSNSTFKSPKKIMNKVKIENNIDFKDLGGFMKKIKMEIYELETNNNNLEQFKENLDDIIINNDTLLNWKEKIQNNNLVINQKIEFVGKEIKNIFEQIDENKIDYSKFNKD